MIEESALPKSAPAARDGGSYNTLQPAHPNTQIKVIGTGYKQMNVVRHDHVTPESASTRESAAAIIDQDGMDGTICQCTPAIFRAQRYKIDRWIIFPKHFF